MDKLKVLFTAEAEDALLKELYEFCDLEFAGWKVDGKTLSVDELTERLQGKDVLITSYDKVTRQVIEGCADLKLIVCARANPVNVDQQAAKEKGITVSYTPGRNSDATAEFAVALLLNLVRHVSEANNAILSGRAVLDEAPSEMKTDVTWGKVKECHPYM
ncbi:MAG: dihydrofolate reductase, partial [Lachnospiraceae bacterium]|nr:dihydrofolate reductase [Lachnospiraceae bacterium]